MKLAIATLIGWIMLFPAFVGSIHAATAPDTIGPDRITIGTLDFSRAGEANIFDGNLTEEMRASLQANFPGVRIEPTPAITAGFLASMDMLIVTNAAGDRDDNWLTVTEQEAVGNFIENGGAAMVFAEPYFGLSAQNVVDPFRVTFALELIQDVNLFRFVNPPNNPVANGPFGTAITAYSSYYGWFSDLGPYAALLATNDSNDMPSAAFIPENAMAPGSGRVLIFADATIVSDAEEGFFHVNETMFLNGVHYLTEVPEPAAFFLCLGGIAEIWFMARRNRFTP